MSDNSTDKQDAPQPTPVAVATTNNNTMSREQMQIAKLREANNKYKSLLKMAKERIQTQDDQIESQKTEISSFKKKLETQSSNINGNGESTTDANPDSNSTGNQNSPNNCNPNSSSSHNDEHDSNIVRICQRLRIENIETSSEETNSAGSASSFKKQQDETEEIWALIEFETNPESSGPNSSYRKYKKWVSFSKESELQDFIRRDFGEPLSLPSYSLTPSQSEKIQETASAKISTIEEEFRRFRVRAEVQRKQAENTVRALHSNSVFTTQQKIDSQDLESELKQARADHAQLAQLKNEMADLESKWKNAYDTLAKENEQLKSSGAEALLAAQWRQRYESTRTEKEDFEIKLKYAESQLEQIRSDSKKMDAGKYESKYRDLKESFRLYRKKAKEIFEAQQRGEVGVIDLPDNKGTEDAKLQYLRNLMVNYLSSDPAVREHMEGAIGTVLKFSEEDSQRINLFKYGVDAALK